MEQTNISQSEGEEETRRDKPKTHIHICITSDTDNSVEKVWDGAGAGRWGIMGGKNLGTFVILSTIK